MSGALDLYQAALWRIWLLATAVVLGAGGLMVSGSAGLIGLMLLPVLAAPALRASRARPLALAVFVAAIAWTALSFVWSPYERPDQALKLSLLTPLYLLAVFAAAHMDDARATRRLVWITAPFSLLAIFFIVEALAGAPVSVAFKRELEGYVDPALTQAHAWRTLARGMTGYLMIAGPAAIALLVQGGWIARAGAGLLALGGLAGGFAFGVEANLLALATGCAAAALAWRFTGRGLGALCFAGAAALAAAPLYMAALTSLIGSELAASLPLSWHMRLEIWRYALEQIAAAPVTGHGLDATRVLGEETELRGTRFNTLPLHAHNAGLQIWLETGFIGAMLFSGALAALGRECMRASIRPGAAAAAAFAGAAFLITVLVGSGVWQEWLHGCLAIGLAAALMIRR